MSSSSSDTEESFRFSGGEFTEAEKRYLIRKGLAWENSKGELIDVSTDVEDDSPSTESNVHEKFLPLPNADFSSHVSHNESTMINSEANDSRVIVPCTQNSEESYQSAAGISIVSCSQESTESESEDSEEDLDVISIKMMTVP
ncbi:unnamed protein product [Orchesella dallaii]|uniref:Uncharacterized protein n=1 Tax=Orchesella dallaii TaxID=48710 RepID=A0ABP1PZP1_9HEXA